jgi:2-octaprenyl-6-methoxyphenol hydroxylase
LRAPLIIAADGAQSQLRGLAGIGTVGHDYGQSGIVTTIGHELDHAGTAYEHFRPAGPFASLPLQGRRSSLVWTETTSEAARYKAMPLDQVALEIEAVMGATLDTVTVEEPLQTFPLRLQIARDFVARRLAPARALISGSRTSRRLPKPWWRRCAWAPTPDRTLCFVATNAGGVSTPSPWPW